MTRIEALSPEQLYQRCDPDQFDFTTTSELEELTEYIGQQRALDAIQFAIGMRQEDYHLYVMGPTGIGKHTLVRRYLKEAAEKSEPPDEWCYIHNFDQSHKPRTIKLPTGRGRTLREDMRQLVDDLRSALPTAFETEEYHAQVTSIKDELKDKRESAIEELSKEAEERGINLLRTPGGFAFAPVKDGEVVGPEDYDKLPEDERKRIEADVAELQEKLMHILRREPKAQRKARDRIKHLNEEVASYAVSGLIDDLKHKYRDLSQVREYLEEVRKDVIEHAEEFLQQEQQEESKSGGGFVGGGGGESLETSHFHRYQVNLLIDHGDATGAPVIYEDTPFFQDLTGRVEHIAQMGTLITDFTLIKPGALHEANGGYLIVDALKILTAPYAWESLKRALMSQQVRIQSLEQMFSLASTVSLEPEPIPLNVKVVLIGDRQLYYLLSELDPEFGELFKIAADFEEQLDRTPEHNQLYAKLIATQARNKNLVPLDRSAVARVIEHSARLVSDAEKLSTHMHSIVGLLQEADYWARQGGREVITREDVQQTIDQQIHRSDRMRERLYEAIRRGTILIDTQGEQVGQVNGLSVLSFSHFAFAQPSRITATARLGHGKVIDIEREAKLGGSIHSKGVMILSAFLGSRYARNRPLSLSASLVFEQSYGMVDGDSASAAELCALLSILADTPIRQTLAITGSVNQHGQVQAIGGVNEKIEGFFDVCREQGDLTGEQGVIIPAANRPHLMLRQDVVEAATGGHFHIYAVSHVDEALELLTGLPAGKADTQGSFPADSLNGRVEQRLIELSDHQLAFARRAKENDADD